MQEKSKTQKNNHEQKKSKTEQLMLRRAEMLIDRMCLSFKSVCHLPIAKEKKYHRFKLGVKFFEATSHFFQFSERLLPKNQGAASLTT